MELITHGIDGSIMTSADKTRLAAVVSYVRLRDRSATADDHTLLEILACAAVRYQARTSRQLLNIELQMGGDGIHSPEVAEVLSLPAQHTGPDLSSLDAEALQVVEEVLAASSEQRREPVSAARAMTEVEEAETEAWLLSLNRHRSKPIPAPAATL